MTDGTGAKSQGAPNPGAPIVGATVNTPRPCRKCRIIGGHLVTCDERPRARFAPLAYFAEVRERLDRPFTDAERETITTLHFRGYTAAECAARILHESETAESRGEGTR